MNAPIKLAAALMLLLAAAPSFAQGAQPVVAPTPVYAQATDGNDGTVFQIAGFADVSYIDAQGSPAGFGQLKFNPILHVLFNDRFLFEAELEMEVNDEGETDSTLEYASIDILLNDHATLVVGKFLSPAGYFVQNLHPSWINRLPSMPAGFGHGGAAPTSDLGVQVRGGFALDGGRQFNYAAYVGNGPRLMVEDEDALEVMAEGSTDNQDGEMAYGGRIGWVPMPGLEVGLSAVRGKVQLGAGMSGMAEPTRSFRVEGVDAAWQAATHVELRGEWIRQRVGGADGSMIPGPATWRAWYAQAVYRFGADRWELVGRYGSSLSPHEEATFDQWAVGVNYVIAANIQAKLAWEFNDSKFAPAAADRLLLQLAYGF